MRGDLEVVLFERNFGGYSDETQAVLLEARQGMTPFEIASKRRSMKAGARHERYFVCFEFTQPADSLASAARSRCYTRALFYC